ncbi:MAG: hypothetical protein AAGH74_04380 [Pseudomonadota bacterium]
MIIVVAVLGGAILGWVRATKRGGTIGDRVQYAFAHAIPFGLLATIFVVLAARFGVAA